jgi:hypothetical protein
MDNLKIGEAIGYPVLSVNPNTFLITSAEQDVKVYVKNIAEGTFMDWKAKLIGRGKDSSWINIIDDHGTPIDSASGFNNDSIILRSDLNRGQFPRKAELMVWHDSLHYMSETFTLTQLPQNDYALVLDRSKSMKEYGHFPPVKKAARDFVGLLFENDNITVSSFNQKGKTEFGLKRIKGISADENSVRAKAQDSIDAITSEGYSSIGSGIHYGQVQLDKNVDALTGDKHQNMILLSDGYENFPPLFNEYLSEIPNTTDIYTIGLSDLADGHLLSHIADETGGDYVFSPTTRELKELYGYLQLHSKKQQVIELKDLHLEANEEKIIKISVDSSIQTINFTLHHPDGDHNLQLSDPYHTLYNDSIARKKGNMLYFKDKGYTAYYINNPEPGVWEAKAQNISGRKASALMLGSAYTTQRMETQIEDGLHRPGDEIVVSAEFSPTSPDDAFSVKADVLYPVSNIQYDMDGQLQATDETLSPSSDGKAYLNTSGDTIYKTQTIQLLDNGEYHDGLAGDGFFTGTFHKTNSVGSYTFRFKAKDAGGKSFFQRYQIKSTVVSDQEYADSLTQVTVPGDFFSIQEAIDSVYSWGGGLVKVKEGTYQETITNYNTVWVISEGDPAKTIIDGGHKKNVVVMDHVVDGGLIGFTIKNSQSNGNFAGIKMTGSQTPVIANCIITDNKHGMFIAGDVRAFIANNLIMDNARDGIRISGSCQSVIFNNIIMENKVGFEANGQPVKMNGFNNIWSNTHNYRNIGSGEGAITEYPDFVSKETHDFHLNPSSACIDAGHYAVLDTNGTRSDIGVYGGMHKYWRNFFTSNELPPGLQPDTYTFGHTGVSIQFDSTGLKNSSIDSTTVSRISKQLFIKNEQKSINKLWNIYSNEEVESKRLSFQYQEEDVLSNKLDESTLVLARYDSQENKWIKQEDSRVNASLNQVSINRANIEGYWTILQGEEGTDQDQATGMDPNEEGLSVTHVYPNPSNGNDINIEFRLPESDVMGIHVYDLNGTRINTLANKRYWSKGTYRLTWDGTDYAGNKVMSNTYVFYFESQRKTYTRKVLIIK